MLEETNRLNYTPKYRSLGRGSLTALALVFIASLARSWPLESLGYSVPYKTYYLAVVVGGFLGGFFVGMLTAASSALVLNLWSPFGSPFIELPDDLLALSIFLLNCFLISLMAEFSHRILIEMNKARNQAEIANERKTVFLSNVSHEMRTPLNSIIGMSYLLRQGPITREQYDLLDRMDGSARALRGLITDLLDMSKIEAGELSVTEGLFSLEDFLDDIGSEATEQGAGSDMDLLVLYGPNLPRTVIGDRYRLRQILLNLISNSFKFAKDGSVNLRLSCDWTSESTIEATFAVEDEGPGIPAAKLQTIFEPFVQVESGLDRYSGGVGLGLAICRELAEILGGTITAENRATRGAKFTLTVPLTVKNPEDRLLDDLSSYRQTRNIVLGREGSAAKALCDLLSQARVPFEQTQDPDHFEEMLLDQSVHWNTAFVAQRLSERELTTIRDALLSRSRAPNLVFVSRSRSTQALDVPESSGLNFNAVSLPVLPASVATAMKDRTMLTSELPTPTSTLAFSGVTVLVVDDDEDSLVVAKGILESLGVDVTCRRDGVSALEFLQEATPHPDIVFMDVQMPGMSGIEVTRRIRESPRMDGLTVIALSASAFKGDIEACLAAGMNDHVPKPINPALLEVAVRRHTAHLSITDRQEPEPGATRSDRYADQTTFDFGGVSILLIEDDFHLAHTVQTFFEMYGASVQVARDNAMLDAIVVSPVDNFDLVISDVQMGDGQDVGETLTAMRQSILQTTPIILISGSPSFDPDRFPEPYYFLPKPFRLTELGRQATRMIEVGRGSHGPS